MEHYDGSASLHRRGSRGAIRKAMHEQNWKTSAVDHLPQYRDIVERSRSETDLWQELKELIADCRTDSESLQRIAPIFDYAWWCVAHSGDSGLEAAARCCFFEDLPTYSDTQEKITPFLDPEKYRTLRSSLSARIDETVFARLFGSLEASLADDRHT